MSEASVRAFFAAHAPDIAVIDQGVSTATVLEAAAALGVEPARIAKTLSLRVGETVALVCTRGDARLSNGKARAALGAKPRMLGADEVEANLAVTLSRSSHGAVQSGAKEKREAATSECGFHHRRRRGAARAGPSSVRRCLANTY